MRGLLYAGHGAPCLNLLSLRNAAFFWAMVFFAGLALLAEAVPNVSAEADPVKLEFDDSVTMPAPAVRTAPEDAEVLTAAEAAATGTADAGTEDAATITEERTIANIFTDLLNMMNLLFDLF